MDPTWNAQVRHWATTEDYAAGLRLYYQRYGNTITYQALCLGENSFNQEKLRSCLVPTEVPAPVVSAPVPVADAPRGGPPTEILGLKTNAARLMDERLLLKEQLRQLPDPVRRDDRKVLAFRIMDLTAQLDTLFATLGYWERYGELPPPPEPESADEPPALRPQRLLTLRASISKTRRKLADATDTTRRALLTKKLTAWEQELYLLERQP
jgi:hypothetical protein